MLVRMYLSPWPQRLYQYLKARPEMGFTEHLERYPISDPSREYIIHELEKMDTEGKGGASDTTQQERIRNLLAIRERVQNAPSFGRTTDAGGAKGLAGKDGAGCGGWCFGIAWGGDRASEGASALYAGGGEIPPVPLTKGGH
jgi:hypothetical protein